MKTGESPSVPLGINMPQIGDARIRSSMQLPSEPIDILICGGGSAGCVLASRLSEDPATRVLLCEAGRDVTPSDIPDVLASPYPGRTYFQQEWLWGSLQASRGDSGTNQPTEPWFYEQARLLGGGSSINGICANRGSPYDYDEWAAIGAHGWSWSEVLPYFKKLETDADFGEPLHGQSGPLPIQRHRKKDWTDYTRTMADIFADMGYALQEDQNGAWSDGVFPTTFNVDADGRRGSAALKYLSPEVRRRPNLTVLTETPLDRLEINGGRVEAAHFTRNDAPFSVTARQVIVSAGALQSPVMLMKSGIGPGAHLTDHGIEVKIDRPGVGENLQEHPNIGISGYLRSSARLQSSEVHHLQALLRYSSNIEGIPPGDMHVAIAARGGWHAVGQRIGTLGFWVNKSYSTGRVRLSSSSDRRSDIDFRMLSDPRDMARLKEGFRIGVRAMTAAKKAGVVLEVFPSGYSPRIRELLRPTTRNAAIAGVAAPLMDASNAVRKKIMAYAIGTEYTAEELAADDTLLEAHLRKRVNGTWHPCGSCRMGDPSDRMAVTDPSARVIGVEGLRVCDASLMPTVPCANLNVPVLMIAEKTAATIRAGG
jgi:5-(hydroxymethyl)furfural/furfural oxidase